ARQEADDPQVVRPGEPHDEGDRRAERGTEHGQLDGDPHALEEEFPQTGGDLTHGRHFSSAVSVVIWSSENPKGRMMSSSSPLRFILCSSRLKASRRLRSGLRNAEPPTSTTGAPSSSGVTSAVASTLALRLCSTMLRTVPAVPSQ